MEDITFFKQFIIKQENYLKLTDMGLKKGREYFSNTQAKVDQSNNLHAEETGTAF